MAERDNAHHVQIGGRTGAGIVRIGHAVLHQPESRGLQIAHRLFERRGDEAEPLIALAIGDGVIEQRQPCLGAAPAVLAKLAADQIHRLDAVGAFVNLGDAGVADELFHAPFADIAMAAINLLAFGGDFIALVGEIALDDRGEQRDQIIGLLARFRGRRLVRQVDLQRPPQRQRPGAFVEGTAVHQHPPHIGMDDNRIGLGGGICGAGQRAALDAVLGIGNGVLIGELALCQPLDADPEACRVHHDEHGAQALVLLADQITGGAIIVHHAGGIAVNAHLVLDRAALDRVARAQRAVVIDDELGHDEQRNALHIVGRASGFRQHEMDDIVVEIMLPGRNEYLGTGKLVRTIGLRFGAGADEAKIGAAMRLGQVHRAGPMAGDHLGQIFVLLLGAADRFDSGLGAVIEARIHRKRHVGARQELLHHHADDIGQPLPAIFGIGHQRAPAGFDELGIGGLETCRRRHAAIVVSGAAFNVTRQVERRQHFLAEFGGFLEDGGDGIRGRSGKAGQAGMALQVDNGIEDKQRVLHRSAIAGHGGSLTAGRGRYWLAALGVSVSMTAQKLSSSSIVASISARCSASAWIRARHLSSVTRRWVERLSPRS